MVIYLIIIYNNIYTMIIINKYLMFIWKLLSKFLLYKYRFKIIYFLIF